MLHTCALKFKGDCDEFFLLMRFAYNNIYHSSIKIASYKSLYDRKCKTYICWDEMGERIFLHPKYVAMMCNKVHKIRERLKIFEETKELFRSQKKRHWI